MVETFGFVSSEPQPDRVARWCDLQLLGYMGYAPELSKCVECRNDLAATVNAFSPALGGVVCAGPGCGGRGGDPVVGT